MKIIDSWFPGIRIDPAPFLAVQNTRHLPSVNRFSARCQAQKKSHSNGGLFPWLAERIGGCAKRPKMCCSIWKHWFPGIRIDPASFLAVQNTHHLASVNRFSARCQALKKSHSNGGLFPWLSERIGGCTKRPKMCCSIGKHSIVWKLRQHSTYFIHGKVSRPLIGSSKDL